MIVIPVNCVGVLGCGVAKRFKDIYKYRVDSMGASSVQFYEYLCDTNNANIMSKITSSNIHGYFRPYLNLGIHVGTIRIYKCKVSSQQIIFFPTKHHFKNKSELSHIERGLQKLVLFAERSAVEGSLKTMSVPALGCGAGGLNWQDVKPIMKHYLSQIPNVKITIFMPLFNTKPKSTK
jgi:hypothetical protein